MRMMSFAPPENFWTAPKKRRRSRVLKRSSKPTQNQGTIDKYTILTKPSTDCGAKRKILEVDDEDENECENERMMVDTPVEKSVEMIEIDSRQETKMTRRGDQNPLRDLSRKRFNQ